MDSNYSAKTSACAMESLPGNDISPFASLKIALLLATGISVHFSLTPPNTASPKTIVPGGKKTLFERAVLWVTFCSKMMVWLMTLSDALATYMAAYHPALSSSCPHHSSLAPTPTFPPSLGPSLLPNALLTPSPLLVLGTMSCLFGSLLRQWCFRKLGNLFTFEVTIQPEHTLITTGPYGVVRHPSYTGIYLTLLGSTAVGLARGSWLREYWFRSGCVSDSTWGVLAGPDASIISLLPGLPTIGQVIVFALVAFWLVKVWYALRSTNRRTIMEDQELRKVFGETWDAYARNVPWRLCPGVY